MGEQGEARAPAAPPALPDGTVTFLFTDLEGSTKLLEAHPAAYRTAVRRHHDLLQGAVEGHGGAVFETVGDAVYAAFARPTDAVAAALAGQRALRVEDWGAVGALRARIGLHLGEVEVQGAHYFGAPLYRCARLTAAAHGGQVVLSAATAELVRGALPDGASLRDLGEHRLKDLQRPERVFQLAHPDLPGDFPPLSTLDARRTNLPVQLTSFVGREQELAELGRLLESVRLLTLTGPGGTGKTRLALQAAADALEAYPDGVWLAELGGLADPTLVPQAVAGAVGVREEPGRPLPATLADALKPRRLLLVLDNCEHLLDSCARLADALLHACPDLRLLATSREALGTAGEAPWRVPSLGLPDPQRPPPVAALTEYEAVRLFCERARAVRADFVVTDQTAPTVAAICRRLDGIPLALELAAARVRMLPVEQIARLLDDRFRLLTGGSRAALPRQQTLRATMDWSYALLSGPERVLLRRLSVFAGGWALEGAQAVGAGGGGAGPGATADVEAGAVLDLLTQLVDKSLVQADPSGGAARFRLLETVRLYGRDRLLEAGEAAAVRDRHRDWCLALVRAPAPGGPRRAELVPDSDNLRAALEWGLDAAPTTGLELATDLADFWRWRGRHEEAARWLEAALARVPPAAAAAPEQAGRRARALYWLGRLVRELGETERARPPLEESLAGFRHVGDGEGAALVLQQLGLVARAAGRPEEASQRFEEALALYRQAGRIRDVGMMQRDVGLLWLSLGDLARAAAALAESVALGRQTVGRPDGVALARLGVIARLEGDPARARQLLEEALAHLGPSAMPWSAWVARAALGDLAAAAGDAEQARAHYRQIVTAARELEFPPGWELGLAGLGLLALQRGDVRRAARLLGALTPAQLERTRMHAPYVVPPVEAGLATCRAALGDAAFETIRLQSLAIPPPDLAGDALEDVPPAA